LLIAHCSTQAMLLAVAAAAVATATSAAAAATGPATALKAAAPVAVAATIRVVAAVVTEAAAVMVVAAAVVVAGGRRIDGHLCTHTPIDRCPRLVRLPPGLHACGCRPTSLPSLGKDSGYQASERACARRWRLT